MSGNLPVDISAKPRKVGLLRAFIVGSIAVHLLALLALGAYKFAQFLDPQERFIAPEIDAVPQLEPEYHVTLESDIRPHLDMQITGSSDPILDIQNTKADLPEPLPGPKTETTVTVTGEEL